MNKTITLMIWIVALAGCGSCGSSERCVPRESVFCTEGKTYWVDSCGEMSEIKEECACGCRNDRSECKDCDCVPRCAGSCCGDDGCGDICPDDCASQGLTCDPDTCTCADDCAPKSCAEQGYQCGTWTDGCGERLECGACPAGESCDAQGRCQSGCPAGTTLCDDRCVDTDTDPRHCGRCENVCDPGQVCEAGGCVQGPDCRVEGCTGLTYCDLNTGNCLPGCITDDQCPANEHCEIADHDCACDSGFHRCAGACVNDASPLHCGTRCDPCPNDPHGTPTCGNGQCGLACDAGYLECAGACVACADPHGAASCSQSGGCQITCDAGYHLCNGACASDASPQTCGTSCTPCPAPAHAQATCTNGACGFVCDTGYHRCAEACYPDDDPDHCGAACVACPDPPGGTALCVDGQCVDDCPGSLTLCGSECVNTGTNEDHCGGCDLPCATGSTCQSGSCVCLTGWTLGPFTTIDNDRPVWWADTGDVDGDGALDVVTACARSTSSEYGEIRVMTGNGDGTFAATIVHELPNEHRDLRSISLGHFDGDTILDAAILFKDYVTYETWYLSIGIWNGAGDGTFTLGHHQGTGYTPNASFPMFIQASDLDANGVDDLVVIKGNGSGYTGSIRNFQQDPVGTFVGEYFENYDGLYVAAIGNWNGDAYKDLVITRPWGDCLARRGTNYFGYTDIGDVPCGDDSAAALGDLDGAPGDETVIARLLYQGGEYLTEVTVYGYTGGSLSPLQVYTLPGGAAYAADIHDLDGDGAGDVLVAHRDADSSLSIQAMMGGGDGTLCIHDAQTTHNPDSPFVRFLPRDFTGDGCTDVLMVAERLYLAEGICSD